MLPVIRQIYEAAKVYKAATPAPAAEEAPITHTKVFHKQYPRFPRISLPESTEKGELSELLTRRETERVFTGEPLTVEELAQVLHSCRIVDAEREPERRTYPSAGARFPVEVYPIVFDVTGLEPGCYHYDIAGNTLEVLWEQDLGGQVVDIVSPHTTAPSAALVFTAVIARAEVKYGARAYPFSLLEAGHMAQNMALACTKLSIGCCPIGGFVNDTLVKIIDLTEHEIPIYVLALGKGA
jgi:SagB-type dehydrogenase family enzyme